MIGGSSDRWKRCRRHAVAELPTAALQPGSRACRRRIVGTRRPELRERSDENEDLGAATQGPIRDGPRTSTPSPGIRIRGEIQPGTGDTSRLRALMRPRIVDDRSCRALASWDDEHRDGENRRTFRTTPPRNNSLIRERRQEPTMIKPACSAAAVSTMIRATSPGRPTASTPRARIPSDTRGRTTPFRMRLVVSRPSSNAVSEPSSHSPPSPRRHSRTWKAMTSASRGPASRVRRSSFSLAESFPERARRIVLSLEPSKDAAICGAVSFLSGGLVSVSRRSIEPTMILPLGRWLRFCSSR